MSEQSLGNWYKRLNEALCRAFPTKPKLEQMLDYGLSKKLDKIVKDNNLDDMVFELTKIATAQGWLGDLIGAASEENSNFTPPPTPKDVYIKGYQEEIELTEKYIEHVEKEYGRLFVLGQANLKPIDEIYTALNLLEKVTALTRYAPDNLSDLFIERCLLHEKHERCDGLDLVKKGSNLFILGKPGAGKTTFLKHVAIKAARKELNADSKIPVFISLHSHSRSGKKIAESVEDELFCGFPKSEFFGEGLLHSGRAIVLFDGLDEVREEGDRRSNTIQELKDFMKTYHESQFIITCRVAATEYSFENVTYVEMADFDEKQIHTFVTNWFRDNEELAKLCWKDLNDEEHKGLREMGHVPLLLGLLCLTYEEIRYFPQRRVEVYEEAIDALLKQWDNKRNIQRDQVYKFLALGRKRQLLNHVAATSFEQGEFLLEKKKLANIIEVYIKKMPDVKEEKEIDGEVIINAIAAQHGIFVERALKRYSFAHLSFQEYFVAKYIEGNALGGSLANLLNHATNDQWREIFLLTVSLLDKGIADEFFELFLKTIEELIAQDKEVQRVLAWVDKKTKQVHEELNKYQQHALRFWYIYRAHAHTHNRIRTLTHAHAHTHNRIRALTLTLNLDRAHALALDRALAHALGFDYALNLDFVYELAHALDFDCTLDFDLDFILVLAHALACDSAFANYIKKAIKNAKYLNYHTIRKSLSKLLDNKLSFKEITLQLKEIRKDFQKLSGLDLLYSLNNSDEKFIRSLSWNKEFINRIATYLKANCLIVDCLELAFVSDKQSILDRLALPASDSTSEDLSAFL